MARHRKNAAGAIVPTPARLVQPLTKAQGKLLDALIDDPTLSPADLCAVAQVPAYTWRRALRSPAFAAALLDAQRSALDASRLSRTQAAIEKAQTSPAFARLCFQIDGSIKDVPPLVLQLNQHIVNMPVSQLRRDYDRGAIVQIPNLNYSEVRGLHNTAIDKHYQENKELKGSLDISSTSGCPTSHDLPLTLTIPLPISDYSEVIRGEGEGVPAPKCSDVAVSGHVVAQHSRAWAVQRVQAGQAGAQAGTQQADGDRWGEGPL